MIVLTFVSGDDDGRVMGGSFDSLFDAAAGGGAAVIASWVRAVFNGFLTVLPPPVTVVQMIHFGLGHERKSGLCSPFLVLDFGFQPNHQISKNE